MAVLLLGGTGAIGTYLKDILNKNGVATSITTRGKRQEEGVISYIQGNAHDIQFLNEICSRHWDAIVDFMSYKTEEFKQRVDLLLNSTDQYIYISSARVYADMEHPIKETSPRLLDVSADNEYLSTDEYALTKARQEDILKTIGGGNYTIIRPYITYGNYRLQLGVLEKEEWLYRALKGRSVVFSKEISERITTLTNGYDVAYGIYKLIGKPKAYGETFHITSKVLITWKEVFRIYQNAIKSEIGKDINIKFVDTSDFLSCRNANLKYQVIYDRLYDRDFDTTKETMMADANSFVSPYVGIVTCIKEFLAKPHFQNINWEYEAKKDKLTGEWTSLSEIPGLKSKFKYIINRIK